MAQKSKINVTIAKLKDAEGILNALKQNLIEIKDVDEISQSKRIELGREGFLRKEAIIRTL